MQSAKIRPGANCGLDHQLLIAKFRLKLKKTGKNNRPARYDLNQILFEFAVEVTNRFKGLDLVNSEPEEQWMKSITLYRSSEQNHPKEKEEQDSKVVI